MHGADSVVNDPTPVRLRDDTEAFVVPLLPAHREALRHVYDHLSPHGERLHHPVAIAIMALQWGWSLLEAAAVADDWAKHNHSQPR